MGGARRPLRRRPAGLRRRPARGGVLRRVRHREVPQRRQPLRLRADHGEVRGAPGVPAAGADVRGADRAGAANGVHRRRGDRHRQLLLGLLRLRRLPRLDRLEAAARGRLRGRREGGVRGEPDAPGGRAARAVHQPLPRNPAGRPGGRPPPRHPDARRPGRHRHHRRALRLRLHPGHLRPHPGPVHRLHRQRLRPDGTAPAVLPHRRAAETAGPPLVRAVGDPGLHRRQAAAARAPRVRGARPGDLGARLPGGDRRRPRGDDGHQPGRLPPRRPGSGPVRSRVRAAVRSHERHRPRHRRRARAVRTLRPVGQPPRGPRE